MHQHYLVKLKIRVFVKTTMLGKQNSTNFYLFTTTVASFTAINISGNKLCKYYFNILALSRTQQIWFSVQRLISARVEWSTASSTIMMVKG